MQVSIRQAMKNRLDKDMEKEVAKMIKTRLQGMKEAIGPAEPGKVSSFGMKIREKMKADFYKLVEEEVKQMMKERLYKKKQEELEHKDVQEMMKNRLCNKKDPELEELKNKVYDAEEEEKALFIQKKW